MYSRNSFGSYYPIDSIIHRLNPILKIFNFILTIGIIIFAKSLEINVFLLLLILLMIMLSHVPSKYYLNTVWSMRYIYILIAVICAFFGTTLTTCMTYIIKLISLVEYISILAFTTAPSENIYGIERLLQPINFFFLPLPKYAFKINSILRYYPLFLSVEYKTFKACASRGIDYYNTNILKRISIFTKVQSNIRRLTKFKNGQIMFASVLRLFHDRRKRSNYRTNKIGFYDIFFTIFHLALIYAILVERGIL